MDTTTAHMLSDLTSNFYQQVGSSFSATRQAPWAGWQRVVESILLADGEPVRVLDLACGNLRFERFLASEGVPFVAHAVDNCDDLVALGLGGFASASDSQRVVYHHVDLIDGLFGDGLSGEAPWPKGNDLCVSFGFMHHIALPEHRRQVMHALVEAARPGGVVAVTFWQFVNSQRLMAKAVPVEGGDEGDFLLGWQHQEGVWRYCHSYDDAEIDALVEACGGDVHEVARFSADGRTNDLNRYLILQK
ncbi:MAG: class I SAM-dependent methyltransferase [Atopobiaceae bacterium]|nr:class I SAM-dependent methyltransferase [Atopobiaceae bacterium]